MERGGWQMSKTWQHFNKPLLDVIKSRRSVRSYRNENLSSELTGLLRDYIAGLSGPFDRKFRLVLFSSQEIMEKTKGKIGTYGVIRGAHDYIAGVVEKGDKGLEQLGYVLEKFILYAASLELGTCWLGGTFSRRLFSQLVELGEDERLPVVTPVGYPGDKMSMLESLMRFGAGSNKRKPWDTLFFDGGFTRPLVEGEAAEYAAALEAVRLAPSASNKQPWRILRQGKATHFYLRPNPGYGKALGFNIQEIDLGIAMCHFEMMLQEAGLQGRWIVADPGVDTAPQGELYYTASWVAEDGEKH
jgi:nitroreductase